MSRRPGLARFRVLPSEFVMPDAGGIGASQRGSVARFVEARSAKRASVLTKLLLTLERGFTANFAVKLSPNDLATHYGFVCAKALDCIVDFPPAFAKRL